MLVLTLLAACHSSDEFFPPPNVPPGAMSYTGYDEDGRPVVKGWIRLDIDRPVAALTSWTGEWELHALARFDELGPQIGHGTLEGDFVDGRFIANLNPNGLDDNVLLNGTLTIIGPRRTGTFKASE